MANINKTYDFNKSEESLYIIDNYDQHSSQPSLNLDINGNIKLSNFSENRNTDNFYGDGRLGLVTKKNTDKIRPTVSYARKIINHDIYGWCLFDNWYKSGSFKVNDEVVILKKHIFDDSYLDELGTWEYLTITGEVVDDEGTHYTISDSPMYEYTDRTANAVALVLQYDKLEILSDCAIKTEPSTYSTCDMPADLWDARRISIPDTILAIKAQKEIILGEGAYIWSSYGYNGASSFYSLYSTNRTYYYADAGAPMGCGYDSRGTNVLQTDIRDTRSAGSFRKNRGNLQSNEHDFSPIFGPGGLNSYGIRHEDDTQFGVHMPKSDDLNEKLYCGLGASNFYFGEDNNNGDNDTRQAREMRGSSGGGIVIIQTPKITFADDNARIMAMAGIYGSRRRLGYGSGGSILIKAEEMNFLANPNLSAHIDDDNGYNKRNLTTSRVATDLTTYPDYVAQIGQIQLEFDRWNSLYEEKTYSNSDIPDETLKNHIQDYYSIAKNKAIGERGTVDEWTITDLQLNFSHQHYAPQFETDTWFKFYTQGMKNIKIDNWYDIYRLQTKYFNTPDTDIRILFSLDAGENWKYINLDDSEPTFDDTSLSESDITDKSNTPKELSDFTNQTFLTRAFILSQRTEENKTIDLCIALKTTKDYITPIFDSLWVEYDRAPILDAPVPIVPYNGEEFNNEFVDFVWLQPIQKYGSIQNRIEINNSSDFSQDENILLADKDDNSSTHGRIIIPFKEAKYDGAVNTANNFKLPYMKKRKNKVINSYDIGQTSFEYNVEDQVIEYAGGDEFFRKGEIITLVAQDNIAVPSEQSFMLDIDNCTKHDNIISYINFTGTDDFSTITDEKFTWDYMTAGDEIQVRENPIDTYRPYFTDLDKSRITFGITPTELPHLLDRTKERTIMIRFNPRNIIINANNYLYNIYNAGQGHNSILNIRKVLNQFNEPKIYINYYDGYTWHSKSFFELIQEDSEAVIVLTYVDNACNIYVNGIKIMHNITGIYDDTNSPDYIEKETKIVFGQDYGESGTYNFIGEILEFGVWDIELLEDEIKEISKIPTYHLRYNFATNDTEWLRVPYWDHLQDYQYVTDKVQNFTSNDDYNWDISEAHFANTGGRCYYTNHTSILIGTFAPEDNINYSFKKHEASHKPINGIPALYNRIGRNNKSFKEELIYKDNNSVNSTYNNTTTYIIEQGRYDMDKTDIEVNFIYRDSNFTSNYQDFGLVNGTMATCEYSGIEYSRYAFIRKYKDDGDFRFSFNIRHSNNNTYNIKDPGNVNSKLPFPLKDNGIYSLKFIANDDITNTEVKLYSITDENYKTGITLFKSEDTSYTITKYGYDTQNFNDRVIGLNKLYEEFGTILRIGEKPAFELICLNSYLSGSDITQEPGYRDTYEITQHIDNDFLKKINSIEVKGENESALNSFSFYCSFDNSTWKSLVDGEWKEGEDGMTIDTISKLNTYDFNLKGGFTSGNDFIFKTILSSLDNRTTPLIDSVKIKYNGPIIIDSWDEESSYYAGLEFYYNEGTWNPYIDPDFLDDTQEWKKMGSGMPDVSNFEEGHGSKPSTYSSKIFGGVRVQLNPKGKNYWRVAAFNGQKK